MNETKIEKEIEKIKKQIKVMEIICFVIIILGIVFELLVGNFPAAMWASVALSWFINYNQSDKRLYEVRDLNDRAIKGWNEAMNLLIEIKNNAKKND